jgi:hypothetical protein
LKARRRRALAPHQHRVWRAPGRELPVDPPAAVLPELTRTWPAFDGGLSLPGIAPPFGQFRRLSSGHQGVSTARATYLEDPFLETHVDPNPGSRHNQRHGPRADEWSIDPCPCEAPMLNQSTVSSMGIDRGPIGRLLDPIPSCMGYLARMCRAGMLEGGGHWTGRDDWT